MTVPTPTANDMSIDPPASTEISAVLNSLIAAEGNFASARSFIHALDVLGESIVPVDFETANAITTICGVLMGQVGAAEAKVNEARRILSGSPPAPTLRPGFLDAA